MMKRIKTCLLFGIFFLPFHQIIAQPVLLSEQAEISILTMGPFEEELYSAFGHSAIRVYDPPNNIDLAFNYGTFDFDQPNFYLNFARGFLLYKLSVQHYPNLERYYKYYDRFINEQVLNLSKKQKQNVYDFLANNAKPENATYYYDYFYDNCATRIRDVFEVALEGEISFDGSYIDTNYTIRDLTDLYLIGRYPWGDLGIDICLGLPMDKVATPYEYMYIPDYLESGFDHATIVDSLGRKVPIVRVTNHLYTTKNPKFEQPKIVTPLVVFSLALILVIMFTFLNWKKVKTGKALDGVLFISTGAIGLLLFMLWFFTDHKAAANNFNIIWAFPINLFMGILLFTRSGKRDWIGSYFLGFAVLQFLLLISWQFLPQLLHFSLIPVSGILLIRSLYIAKSEAYRKYRISE